MKLIKPNKKYEKSWKKALEEFEKEQVSGFWNFPAKPSNLDEYIQRTIDHSNAKNIPENLVPATTYWLIDKNEFVAHINIRHKLNDKLKKIGGNIGYSVRPSAHKKGYGTNILKLALPKAKEIGLKKALITCDDGNIASEKIIERNGGKLKEISNFEGKKIRRYWIDLN